MHFQKLFFIIGLIYSMISALSVADAMENDNDSKSSIGYKRPYSPSSDSGIVKDKDSAGTASSSYLSSEDDSDDDSDCSQYGSGGEYSENQEDGAPKRFKMTSYLSAEKDDSFLADMGDGIPYVRAYMNEDGTFTDHKDGDIYVPLYKIHAIEWAFFPFTPENWTFIGQGISPLVRRFDIAGCNLNEASIRTLKPYLHQRNLHLKELCIFQQSPLSVEGCFDLIEVASSSPVLSHFVLNNMDVDDTVLGGVLTLMQFKRLFLDTVELGSSISPKGLETMLSFLKGQDTMSLKDLYMEVTGDFTRFNILLLDEVLKRYPRLGIKLVFNPGSIVNASMFDPQRFDQYIRFSEDGKPEHRLEIDVRSTGPYFTSTKID